MVSFRSRPGKPDIGHEATVATGRFVANRLPMPFHLLLPIRHLQLPSPAIMETLAKARCHRRFSAPRV